MNLNWASKGFGISGIKLLTPFFREDERGFFLKSYQKDIYEQWGINESLSETFETWSKYSVVRGLHFQTKKPQAKIVRVLSGKIYDVAVDLRNNSCTFGKWQSVELDSKEHSIFYIPEGFAHGFQVLSEFALVSYQCIGEYFPEFDTGIYWRDSDLNIDWPLKDYITSDKDENLMTYRQFIQTVGALGGNYTWIEK